MANAVLRIGIVGCGRAARIHADRLLSLPEVAIVGCADQDLAGAEALAAMIGERTTTGPIPVFSDHRELLRLQAAEAICIFVPHLWHYRVAMDALQAGCHVFIEKPLSTNVQEAVDIVGLARGRGLKVAVGHQYRLCPSLEEARRRLGAGAIGKLQLLTATMARPWLAELRGSDRSWRFDRKIAGGGVLADAGDHLIDALLWTTGQAAGEAYAVQQTLESGLDLVTAAAVRLIDGTPATLAVSGVSTGPLFELNYFGDRGRMRATDQVLETDGDADNPAYQNPGAAARESIDGDFVSAVLQGTMPCCPASEALETVRLIEAITRSAATGQAIRLV